MRDPIKQKITHVFHRLCGAHLAIVAEEIYHGERSTEIVGVVSRPLPGAVTLKIEFCDDDARRRICNRVAVRRIMARRGEV